MSGGIGLGLGSLARLSGDRSKSISAENLTGENGKGGMALHGTGEKHAEGLGQGWKISPSVEIAPGSTFTLATICEAGAIQSMWFGGYVGRSFILRIFWDDQDIPSVESPLSDFFAVPWTTGDSYNTLGPHAQINSLPVAVNPNLGLNCFWEMPFRKSCRITLENLHPTKSLTCYFQINYVLRDVPKEDGYFHAQFRRVNPLPFKVPYVIVDGVQGHGHYIGTAMGWGINHDGWWGEGEIKFYLDEDNEFPTICGTGVEDYFGGAYCWQVNHEYVSYTTPFLGMHQVIRPDGSNHLKQKHAMYRWHIMDPIRFQEKLRVTIQALGWRNDGRYFPGQHDICSVAYWYQALPTASFPPLPERDELEIV